MKIYEDKTRVMSWGKALAIGFSMTAIAYGLTAWSLHSLLLDRVYLYAACFLLSLTSSGTKQQLRSGNAT